MYLKQLRNNFTARQCHSCQEPFLLISNEGKRHERVALILIAMGMIPGAADDYFIGPSGAGVIEFKTLGNKFRPTQEIYRDYQEKVPGTERPSRRRVHRSRRYRHPQNMGCIHSGVGAVSRLVSIRNSTTGSPPIRCCSMIFSKTCGVQE